jgi:hypothetical protein
MVPLPPPPPPPSPLLRWLTLGRYNFNDSSVHEVAAEEAVSSKAYVLFYKRRSALPLGLPAPVSAHPPSSSSLREGSLKWAGAIPLTEPLDG